MANSVKGSANGIDIKLCRVCLVPNAEMKKLFEDNQKLVKEIEFCTGVLETDGLSDEICSACLEHLSIAYNFKTQCLLTVQTFEKILNNIKEVFPEEDYLDKCKLKIQNDISNSSTINDNTDFKNDVKLECQPKSKIRKRKPKIEIVWESVKPIRILACNPCGVKFQSAEESRQHRLKCHNKRICEICGAVYAQQNNYYRHIKSHSLTCFYCDHCKYQTPHKDDLVKHIKMHFGIKNYKCRQCPQTFTTKSNQLNHERRLHSKMKRFFCTTCDMGFYDKSTLNNHVDSHNSVKRYRCEVCNVFLAKRESWKKHMLRQHKIAVPPQRSGRKRNNLIAT